MSFGFPWLKVGIRFSFEPILGLIIKLYIVTKKMSANLASETNFYIDFEPITFCQFKKDPV